VLEAVDLSAVERPKRRRPQKRVQLHDSGFARERLPKGEALGNRLNLQSPDWTGGGSAPGANKGLTPGEILSALAGSTLTEFERGLVIYYFTQDNRSRSQAFALLLCWLVDRKIEHDWDIRKAGILKAMTVTALEDLLYPSSYRNLSDRAWTEMLTLTKHHDWPRLWRPRYRSLIAYAESVIDQGQAMIATKV
jgi:hypothetical protein